MVGEHSLCVEGVSKEALERKEVSMPQLVTTKQVKNLFAVRPRFPGQW